MTTRETTDLKPCPFCGGPTQMLRWRCGEDPAQRAVECRDCGATTGTIAGIYSKRRAAAWSRRIDPLLYAPKTTRRVLVVRRVPYSFKNGWVVVLGECDLDCRWTAMNVHIGGAAGEVRKSVVIGLHTDPTGLPGWRAINHDPTTAPGGDLSEIALPNGEYVPLPGFDDDKFVRDFLVASLYGSGSTRFFWGMGSRLIGPATPSVAPESE